MLTTTKMKIDNDDDDGNQKVSYRQLRFSCIGSSKDSGECKEGEFHDESFDKKTISRGGRDIIVKDAMNTATKVEL
jgi:hypothetical protein